LLATFEGIQAQEESHAIFVNNALKMFCPGMYVAPCEYKFPPKDLEEAIALAGTFNDVVYGTLANINTHFAENGDIDMIAILDSVMAGEAEQGGFFRMYQGKRPSSQSFLTAATREFAISAVTQNFVVEGSCPTTNPPINLTVFEPLTVVSTPQPGDGCITFSFERGPGNTNYSIDGLQLTYINSQQIPISYPFTNIHHPEPNIVQFDATFPQATDLFFGLTIAAVTTVGNFSDAEDVAAATLFGPGLIEIA